VLCARIISPILWTLNPLSNVSPWAEKRVEKLKELHAPFMRHPFFDARLNKHNPSHHNGTQMLSISPKDS